MNRRELWLAVRSSVDNCGFNEIGFRRRKIGITDVKLIGRAIQKSVYVAHVVD